MKKLFLLFAVAAIGLSSCKKNEHSITYKVTTEYPVDSLQIQTLAAKNFSTVINSSTVMISSSIWTKTISDADINEGTHYEIKALYHGQENPGKIHVSIYQDNNLITEGSQQAFLIDPVTYYSEPSCFYMF